MSADDLVDAVLTGFLQGEFVTIPLLHIEADWLVMEKSRQAMMQHLSSNIPAERYRIRLTPPSLIQQESHDETNR